MELAVSDLPFAGYKYKSLKNLPTEYGLEIFYEFGNEEYWQKIIPLLTAQRQLPFSIHAPGVAVNLADPTDTKFMKILQETFCAAQKYGAEFVVVHTNEEWSGEKAVVQELVLTRLTTLVAVAKTYGVLLLVENVGLRTDGTLLFNWEEYLQLLEKLPEAQALLDTGHAHVNGWNLPETIKTLGDNLYALHLHDNDGQADQHLMIGKGNICWSEVFTAIHAYTPKARLVLEYADVKMSELLEHITILKEKNFI